jgi:hypothetical protein
MAADHDMAADHEGDGMNIAGSEARSKKGNCEVDKGNITRADIAAGVAKVMGKATGTKKRSTDHVPAGMESADVGAEAVHAMDTGEVDKGKSMRTDTAAGSAKVVEKAAVPAERVKELAKSGVMHMLEVR